MKCSNCNKVALYTMQDNVVFCLDCYHKWSEIQNIHFLQNAAMSNQALDDMDAVTGMSLNSGRIPVSCIAAASQGKGTQVYNNIKIEKSSVGVLNTGDLAKIDAAITMSQDTDLESIGSHLKEFTEAVSNSDDVSKEDQQEIIELLRSISEQLISGRKKSITLALLKSIEDRIKTIPALNFIYQNFATVVNSVFIS